MLFHEKCVDCTISQIDKIIEMLNPGQNTRDSLRKWALEAASTARQKGMTAPELVEELYVKFSNELDIVDPYKQIKIDSNNEMMSFYPMFKEFINASDTPIYSAMKIAAKGNIIDYGIHNHQFEIDKILDSVRNSDFSGEKPTGFIEKLGKAESMLYLLDNAGEIVADKALIETILAHFPQLEITAVVRGAPVINDVTIDDAVQTGLTEVVNVITNGVPMPSIPRKGGEAFEAAYKNADIILAKGQGNFETERNDRTVYHLFLAKCDMVADSLGVPTGGMVFYEKQCQ